MPALREFPESCLGVFYPVVLTDVKRLVAYGFQVADMLFGKEIFPVIFSDPVANLPVGSYHRVRHASAFHAPGFCILILVPEKHLVQLMDPWHI